MLTTSLLLASLAGAAPPETEGAAPLKIGGAAPTLFAGATPLQPAVELNPKGGAAPPEKRLTSAEKEGAAPSGVEGAAPSFEVMERIIVLGRKYAPESMSVHGEYDLSREFIEGQPLGNGNISDMLTILPGIQGSESSVTASLQAEIRAQLFSISGAQPWQTGFYFNGVKNNSRLDPAASERSPAQINDVQGHPQATFINAELVESVSVYDSNIPARFGGFSGGVVDVKARSNRVSEPRFSLTVRASDSAWNRYEIIDERRYNGTDEAQNELDETLQQPEFSKRTVNLSGATPIGEDYALNFSLSRTTSTITELSLRQPELTKRESVSSAVHFTSFNWWFDEVTISASHSPYQGQYLLTDVARSNFDIDGGGSTASARASKQFDKFKLETQVNYSFSENSRRAPNSYLPWYRAPGKDWGLNIGEIPFSVEGGYGDIDKEQEAVSFELRLQPNPWQWGRAEHQLEFGVQSDYTELRRFRRETGLVYNSPYRDANIDCRGQTLDCIEQSFAISLAELAAQLGGAIDFSNPEHVAAYQQNLLTRGQAFQYRRVYPLENILVDLTEASAYLEHDIRYQDWQFNLGLRADYDNFLEQFNIAPRLQIGRDFGSNKRLIIGANRYYAANLLTYKIREQQRSYITQYRPLSAGVVQDWTTSATAQRFRYRFDDVRTPYSDEASIAWKQYLGGGVFSIKAVQRWQRDQLSRGDSIERDGLTEIFQTNGGSGQHQRLTLSYQKQFGDHGIWAHTSYTRNETDAESYDASVDNTPEDEIVFFARPGANGMLNYQLVSLDDLTRLQSDFSRPLTATIALRSFWSDSWSTSLNARYVGEYESAENTGLLREISRGDVICSDCDISALNYPVYEQVTRRARTLFDLSAQYNWQINAAHALRFTMEISNLLDARTYAIGANQAGIETGRAFWFGVSYAWQ
ncbi:TonB-dependent receptor plug domain-containing protein [Pseudidiomarina taiwanensis]|uniref:TonB-dependent receptor plug domain-containing protein n=1 Tax=Pseudidiomarina taiwanensis TaxID=337250 RepID=A0A432ZKD5_9GAMM|nr:TonB-dependent receptor plug domain-containing protein [Pseudidiomarina taiwanensis]RUO78373.1 hypothetical protein CWI83_04910 [Pseudidiomarina taiwanensis]